MKFKVKTTKIPRIDFKKFRGKEVAIVKDKIVASGNSSREVFELAKKRLPDISSKDIILLSVPKEKVFAYFSLFLTNKNIIPFSSLALKNLLRR